MGARIDGGSVRVLMESVRVERARVGVGKEREY